MIHPSPKKEIESKEWNVSIIVNIVIQSFLIQFQTFHSNFLTQILSSVPGVDVL